MLHRSAGRRMQHVERNRIGLTSRRASARSIKSSSRSPIPTMPPGRFPAPPSRRAESWLIGPKGMCGADFWIMVGFAGVRVVIDAVDARSFQVFLPGPSLEVTLKEQQI